MSDVDPNFLLALPLAATLALAGCKAHAGHAEAEQPQQSRQSNSTAAPSSRPTDALAGEPHSTMRWEEKTLPLEQSSVAITKGPTPLVYIFDLGASIRVVDVTSGQKLLSIAVPDRTLVRVDDRHGVTVGPENVYPGPLPAGHQYGIYADPTTPNTLRQGTGPPTDLPRR